MNVKKLTILGTLSLIGLGGTLTFQQINLNKISRAETLNSGLGTCFQRISQSFTALMTKRLSSNYLNKSFLSTTSDCISDANKLTESMKADLTKRSQTLLNQFSSDYYWFSQKTLKLVGQLNESDFDISTSNIISKFSTIDDLKVEFSSELSKATDEFKSQNFYALVSMVALFVTLSLTMTAYFIGQRKKRSKVDKLDQEAGNFLDTNFDTLKAKRIFSNTFNLLDMKNAKLLIEKFDSDNNDVVPSSVTQLPEVESTNLLNSIERNLENFSQKVTSYGVRINADKVKNFNVSGSQDLIDQIVFHALNYGIDFSKEKELNIGSSVLGGTAILRISISGHCFNSNELDFLNSSSNSEKVNLDLMLLKELTSDLEGSFGLKNKINTQEGITNSELEFIFTIPSIRKSNTVKVMKGSKKDLLNQFKSEI